MPKSLKKKTVNGMFWSSTERFSVQGIQFILGIFMARLLSPSDYGIIAMLSIFIAVSQSFIDSGFSNALIRKSDRDETDYATVFYFNIFIAVVCYGILYAISPYIASFYNTPILNSLTKVVALSLVFNSLCVVQQAKLTIKIDFKTQAKVSLIAVLISGTIGLLLAYNGFGVWALAIQNIIAAFIRMFLLWLFARWRPQKQFSSSSFKHLFSYGSKLLASGLLDVTYNNIYTIVIGKFFAGIALGNYSRAVQFAQFPSANIAGILQRVTFPILSSIQNEDDRLRINYRKFIRFSAFVVFPLMIGLAVLSEPFIRVLLTDKWDGTIILLQILCFALMWYPIHVINLNLLQVKGRSDLFLRIEIVKKIFGFIILCITIPLGVTAMCIGQIVNSIISLVINIHYTGKIINIGFGVQMKDILPILFNCLLMGIIIYSLNTLITNSLLQLIIGVFIGLGYYVISNLIMGSTELKEIISIIKYMV